MVITRPCCKSKRSLFLFDCFRTMSKIFQNLGRLCKRHLDNTLTVPGVLERSWLASAGIRAELGSKIHSTYHQIPHNDLLLTALGTALVITIARKSLHRYRTAQEIPLRFFKQQKRLHGYAVFVNDSDNIRFYHRPWVRMWCPNVPRNDLKYETINVRLAGIDAPEMAHFGGQSQPYALEAKQWLARMVEGRPVTIWLHRYDQYSRIVGLEDRVIPLLFIPRLRRFMLGGFLKRMSLLPWFKLAMLHCTIVSEPSMGV